MTSSFVKFLNNLPADRREEYMRIITLQRACTPDEVIYQAAVLRDYLESIRGGPVGKVYSDLEYKAAVERKKLARQRYSREYRERNLERLREKDRLFYEQNTEKIREQWREKYHNMTPEQKAALKAKNHAYYLKRKAAVRGTSPDSGKEGNDTGTIAEGTENVNE